MVVGLAPLSQRARGREVRTPRGIAADWRGIAADWKGIAADWLQRTIMHRVSVMCIVQQ
jgi:hypothetical protein